MISSILFGKRNRTEFTDTEFSRYQVFLGTDRYQFLRNRICNGTEEPNRSVRYLPNAQGEAAQGRDGGSGARVRRQTAAEGRLRRRVLRRWGAGLRGGGGSAGQHVGEGEGGANNKEKVFLTIL